jgi:hypothetical protein
LNANRCRERAEQCREIAGSIQDPAEIEQLILLAVEFDIQAAAIQWHTAAFPRKRKRRTLSKPVAEVC